MPPDLLDKIARYLDVLPDYLAGAYHEKADRIEDPQLRALAHSRLVPDKFPYILKSKSDIGYERYFEDILTMNDIKIETFKSLAPEERMLLRQEMAVAILQVLAQHFSHDSLGNDLAEHLSYYESLVGDFDPFSYFAELEGVGL